MNGAAAVWPSTSKAPSSSSNRIGGRSHHFLLSTRKLQTPPTKPGLVAPFNQPLAGGETPDLFKLFHDWLLRVQGVQR